MMTFFSYKLNNLLEPIFNIIWLNLLHIIVEILVVCFPSVSLQLDSKFNETGQFGVADLMPPI